MDEVIKRRLDIDYEKLGPSMRYIICLGLTCHDGYYTWWPFSKDSRWLSAAAQLADCHSSDIVCQSDILRTIFSFHLQRRFVEFCQDATRSGKYTMDTEIYTSISLRCLEYISHPRSVVRMALFHHPRLNFSKQRNHPWQWKTHTRYLESVYSLKFIKFNRTLGAGSGGPRIPLKRLPKIYRIYIQVANSIY